jgi:hypothetical protein
VSLLSTSCSPVFDRGGALDDAGFFEHVAQRLSPRATLHQNPVDQLSSIYPRRHRARPMDDLVDLLLGG